MPGMLWSASSVGGVPQSLAISGAASQQLATWQGWREMPEGSVANANEAAQNAADTGRAVR
jgi:hypothetical protein